MRLGECDKAVTQFGANGGHVPTGIAQQQHDRRVHDVLRRRAEVQPRRHLGTRARQLLQQRQDRIPHEPRALAELPVVDLDSRQLPPDRLGG